MIDEQVKVISFDAADTLIKLALSIGDHYAEGASRYGVVVNAKKINPVFKKVFTSKEPLGSDGQKGLDWWKKVIEETFRELGYIPSDFSDFKEMSHYLYSSLSEKKTWVIFPDVLTCLHELIHRGYKLIVFSNFDERLHKILNDVEIDGFFQKIICSTEIGYAKPNKEAFLEVAKILDCKPSEIMHIGDGLRNDYLGALDAGFKSVLLDRSKAHAGTRHKTITSFDDLFFEN